MSNLEDLLKKITPFLLPAIFFRNENILYVRLLLGANYLNQKRQNSIFSHKPKKQETEMHLIHQDNWQNCFV